MGFICFQKEEFDEAAILLEESLSVLEIFYGDSLFRIALHKLCDIYLQ
jgi:hypothetical protein